MGGWAALRPDRADSGHLGRHERAVHVGLRRAIAYAGARGALRAASVAQVLVVAFGAHGGSAALARRADLAGVDEMAIVGGETALVVALAVDVDRLAIGAHSLGASGENLLARDGWTDHRRL